MKWNEITSEFPCDNQNQPYISCNLFEDRYVIVPSVKDDSSCTAIFNIETKMWSNLRIDDRNAPYHGYFQLLPNSDKKDLLYYYGGFEFQSDVSSQDIWQFDGVEEGWFLLPIKLPKARNHTVKMALIHPEVCD